MCLTEFVTNSRIQCFPLEEQRQCAGWTLRVPPNLPPPPPLSTLTNLNVSLWHFLKVLSLIECSRKACTWETEAQMCHHLPMVTGGGSWL